MQLKMRGLVAGGLLAGIAALAPVPLEAGKANDTLVWASDRENPIADTNFLNTRENFIISFLIFDRLVLLDETYKPQPLLATGWKWVDNVTLDFDLRAGVKFHSGKALDADDVVYSLNFVVDPANGSFSRSYLTWIKSVEKTGDLKVRINLTKPFPAALTFLSGAGVIVPKGHYDAAPLKPDGKRDFGAVKPVGTGPYKLAEIKPGDFIHLVKNAEYFKGGPKIAPVIGAIRFRTIKDQNTRLAEVMTGNVDWIWDVPKELAERVKSNPAVVVENAKTMRFAYLGFDTRGTSATKTFMDKRVRLAVAHAINREAIVKNLVG
ncbi:MAG TPA: ABC transporter substrate-binding protein, partial [Hyphomicrobiaceae bacterium]|nr:ABC transporter substrate-binding protein [Hyphomicrobiaceae bacterium]